VTLWLNRELHQLVGGDREFADPAAGGVEDRVGDGRVDAGGAELADALAADRAGVLVYFVDERDVDVGGDVGVDGQRDPCQVLGQPAAVALVLAAGLHRRLAPAPDDAAEHLRARGARIDDPTDAVAADGTAQADDPKLGVEPDLH